MITDIQLALFANFLGVSLFLLVVLYHYVASNPRSWKLLEFWFSKSCDLCVWWYKSFIEWKILQYSITLQYCLTVLYYHSFGHIVYFYTTIAISFADYKSDKNFIWSFREDFDKTLNISSSNARNLLIRIGERGDISLYKKCHIWTKSILKPSSKLLQNIPISELSES